MKVSLTIDKDTRLLGNAVILRNCVCVTDSTSITISQGGLLVLGGSQPISPRTLGWMTGGEALEVRTTKVSTSLYLSLYN